LVWLFAPQVKIFLTYSLLQQEVEVFSPQPKVIRPKMVLLWIVDGRAWEKG
jgi:hypothetical protein